MNRAAIVNIDGEIDVHTSPVFREKILALIQSGNHALILNCALMTYISSAGFRVLYETLDRLEQTGGKMAFSRLTPEVQSLFEITDMASECGIFKTTEEALASL